VALWDPRADGALGKASSVSTGIRSPSLVGLVERVSGWRGPLSVSWEGMTGTAFQVVAPSHPRAQSGLATVWAFLLLTQPTESTGEGGGSAGHLDQSWVRRCLPSSR
jgi:hypothetical protein